MRMKGTTLPYPTTTTTTPNNNTVWKGKKEWASRGFEKPRKDAAKWHLLCILYINSCSFSIWWTFSLKMCECAVYTLSISLFHTSLHYLDILENNSHDDDDDRTMVKPINSGIVRYTSCISIAFISFGRHTTQYTFDARINTPIDVF